ncbi:sensor histidine kinase [Streptomyces sp. NPDC002537]
MAIALAVPRVGDSLAYADRMGREEKFADLVLSATELAHALQNERDAEALGKRAKSGEVSAFRAATDKSLSEYYRRTSVEGPSAGLKQRLKEAESQLSGLSALRMQAFTTGLDAVHSEMAYTAIVTPLLALSIEAGFASASDGRALYALSVGKASVSTQRALLNAEFAGGGAGAKDEAAAVVAQEGLQVLVFNEFKSAATAGDRELFARGVPPERIRDLVQKAVAPANSVTTPPVAGRASRQASASALAKEEEGWDSTTGQMLDELHKLEMRIAQRIQKNAAESRSAAQHKALREGALVLAALLITVGLAVLIVRATVKKLKRLRSVALRAAKQDLPELVAAYAEQRPGEVMPQPMSIDFGTRDEVGDVSRAFAAVFEEALKQAGEQAALRASVGTMLASMARRSQALVYRQLDVITELEQSEADPEKLNDLFRADHLATRMRRHGENLLVLAGESPGRVHQEPAPLIDVLRAAGAEVEQFERIQVIAPQETDVLGPVVHDLTHLLAELLENATQYSDRADAVAVTSRITLAGDLVIEVDDNGVGIDGEQINRLNAILERTPVMNVAMTRCMGLYVVSQLAAKHGVQVQLRSVGKGCTAVVTVPSSMLARAGRRRSGTVRDFAYRQQVRPVGENPRGVVPVAEMPTVQAPTEPTESTDEQTDAAAPVPTTPKGLPRRVPRAALREDAPTATDPRDGDSASEASGMSPEEFQQRLAGFCGGAERGRQDTAQDVSSDNNRYWSDPQ